MTDGGSIEVRGARQHHLQHLDIDIPLRQLTVVTGVSGSGKSSLAFDTVYAEGQRRYIETFSPYARQFLERMDKPAVDRITGILPAVAIDQTNPVRTSRSTVGTMTELNDHLKLLYARAARLVCAGCGAEVHDEPPEMVAQELLRAWPDGARIYVRFRVHVPDAYPAEEVQAALVRQGYHRFAVRSAGEWEVLQDRLVLKRRNRGRLVEAVEAAYRHGDGRVLLQREDGTQRVFSAGLHCAACNRDYATPVPNLFSFNSAIGACPTCRGFGRTIGIDMGLVVPDTSLTLQGGAVRPWQSGSSRECQRDLLRAARRKGVPVDVPWRDLSPQERQWVEEGEGEAGQDGWYGITGYFQWLERKSYKMHVRVLLSKYRAYHLCSACAGARLKPEALLWRLGPGRGLHVHEVQALPLADGKTFFAELELPSDVREALQPLLGEIRARYRFLVDAGLGYITLDRQSRTLSGGEVQRINLTTALGTTLVNTLFVLDEPTVGLHPRDTARMIGILRRLRDAGNTLLVVEHDPDVIGAADQVIDLGPGAGADGGRIQYFGPGKELRADRISRTAACLRGEHRSTQDRVWLPVPASGHPMLSIRGVRENNLQDIDVDIPLGRLVCVTGVSGSGKSTLVETCLYRGLLRMRGQSTDTPGSFREMVGDAAVKQVELIDQHPLGKTTRSNPASYTGAWDAIRTVFAAQPLARERGYKPGAFSFNAGKRCQVCGGNGYQRIEMQFLHDVYLRCEACDGTRFEAELLDVTMDMPGCGRVHVADVLALTVDQALTAFAAYPKVVRALQPLVQMGLGYLRLGQPVPTLSGGEAQRLKLATYLGRTKNEPVLFLLDEPTTGLHLADVSVLLSALRSLLLQGHSVVVIEHHLDVIRAADWVLDLGPEGGAAGGRLVCAGPPDVVAACADSHTGAALRAATASHRTRVQEPAEPPLSQEPGTIRIQGAREHNLQNVHLAVPRDAFSVITGLSGSGKSTIAFDILYQEGQRRYLDSLNAYARQFVQPASRADVDAVLGIPPTVAIEQRTSRGGWKSTVATVTELYHYFRLLFARLGTQYCPSCDVPVTACPPAEIVTRILQQMRGRRIRVLAPLVQGRKGIYRDLAATWSKRGYDALVVDGRLCKTDNWPALDRYREHDIALPVGMVTLKGAKARTELADLVELALTFGKAALQVAAWEGTGTKKIAPRATYAPRNHCPTCGSSLPVLEPRLFSFHSRHGWCEACQGTGLWVSAGNAEERAEDADMPEPVGEAGMPTLCPVCAGKRLRPEALAVRVQGICLSDFVSQSVTTLRKTVTGFTWSKQEREIAAGMLDEILEKLQFLEQIGLGYLGLDRAAPTLSGGEAQRIRLAAQLGSNLRGVCYVLDEPTIGLHPCDNALLLESLRQLQRKGNTVVVVEHDEDTIRHADHVIDLGPGAGVAGGCVVAEGSPAEILRNPASVTGRYLREPLPHPVRGSRRPCRRGQAEYAVIHGAQLHNLRGIDVRLPLERLVCVTGVSGSGKSTLIRDVLLGSLRQVLTGRKTLPDKVPGYGCADVEGMQAIRRVDEVDQTPIGRTPRSCPATYVGIWGEIRRLFASTPEARMYGYGPDRFSFNTGEGRCPVCKGNGYQTVEMSFLPNVLVLCEVCQGRRFTQETCRVQYHGKSIAEVLALSVDEAIPVFEAHTAIHRTLRTLQDVGLGYITLGQRSPTVSGGEAQRMKLVAELTRRKTQQKTLYVLDEPSVGLHMGDVVHLIHILHRLVDAGNSVILIEHNLDLMAEADHIVDLGPGGGDAGGRIVAQGPPDVIRTRKRSRTGACLAQANGASGSGIAG